jgi:hypothetical protein
MLKTRQKATQKILRPVCPPWRARAGLSAAAGRRRQRDVLCDVMLSARECETWLTLDELAKLTHYPPASISAQLRHLRKPQFGGFAVEKRQCLSSKFLRGEDFGIVWEYQLRRSPRRILGWKLRAGQEARPAPRVITR